jgi:predicted nucleotidyltransferase
MVQSPATPIGDLRDGLRNVLNRVLSTRPQVRLALLFGSRARGSEHPGSDVDVAVLAPGEDLLALGSQLSQAVGTTVDLVSLEDPGFALLEELVRDSVPIYEAAAGNGARWRSHALSELDLDRAGFERMRDAWLARVANEGLL